MGSFMGFVAGWAPQVVASYESPGQAAKALLWKPIPWFAGCVIECELIEAVRPLLPTNDFVVTGAGDDCAVLEFGAPDTQTLFKTDAVVEGIHFMTDAPAERIGRKALARALSDIAAMGGTPTAALVALGMPKGMDSARLTGIYRGLNALAAMHQVAVVGGETTSSPERLFLSISLLGTVPRGKAVLRSGAIEGDGLFVTGELGGSIEGKHFDFEPRLLEGRWLAGTEAVSAMMDVSDGLASDLPKLLDASRVRGAELMRTAIPISRVARERERRGDLSRPAIVSALCDGEDFELLFTVRRGHSVALLDGWKVRFPGLALTCIGRVTAEPGIWIKGPDGVRPLTAKGYEHCS